MSDPSHPQLPWADAVETHTGAVFFLGELAVKVRKPVHFPFVDLSTADRRRAAIEEELRLNRRLAPDVYCGVGELSLPGDTHEPALIMRRLPSSARLSALVHSGAPGLDATIDRIATRLADFHAGCPARPDLGGVDQLQQLWDDARDLLASSPDLAAPEVVDRVHRQACDYLAGRHVLIEERRAGGCVRDGHGDLLADDVFVLDDEPRILDCLDFDERLRCGDVLLDVAFLAMDLEHLGAAGLARRLLDRYRAASGREQPASLEHFFIAYRAAVRAKVGLLRWAQGDPRAAADVRQLLGMADRHLATAAARLIVVGGLPGSGKTTHARSLTARPGWVLLSTDVVRGGTRGDPGRYSDAARDLVYDAMFARAGDALAHGASVVLDGTFGRREWRQRARTLAAEAHAELEEICCVADDATARARLAARVGDASEADEQVREALAATFDPWPEAGKITADRRGQA